KNTLIGGSTGTVELENCMSETYSAVRNSLLPQLLDVLSKNKHADYPQKIFEEGIVAYVDGSNVAESHSIALASAYSAANFTEMKQYLSAMLTQLGKSFTIRAAEHPAFLKGRAGTIMIGKTPIGSSRLGSVAGKAAWEAIGVIGEISPAVLSKWGIEMPAVAAEINMDFLLKP
ncbi:hypothetical protein HYU20_03410, partial [Candidatus Woesearchaeota archaeon]|nr:hypothetical protein [Candidatus Woesearchaeota archaeon]